VVVGIIGSFVVGSAILRISPVRETAEEEVESTTASEDYVAAGAAPAH
jgi:hypothetical protein